MFSNCRNRAAALLSALLAALLAALLIGACGSAQAAPETMRVCADPDSLPFSNQRGEGFEDKIAGVLAADLGMKLAFAWSSARRGFLRRTLFAGACDVVMAVPDGFPAVATTKPYYRSSYVAVSRMAQRLPPVDFDAPGLRALKIGLPALGADGANTPPAQALARRGIADNITGFPVFGSVPQGQPGRIVDAVAAGEIDLALLWGPVGGYFAQRHPGELAVTPVLADPAQPELAFVFAISLGVRKADTARRDALDGALIRRAAEIAAILHGYGVPLAESPP